MLFHITVHNQRIFVIKNVEVPLRDLTRHVRFLIKSSNLDFKIQKLGTAAIDQ